MTEFENSEDQPLEDILEGNEFARQAMHDLANKQGEDAGVIATLALALEVRKLRELFEGETESEFLRALWRVE